MDKFVLYINKGIVKLLIIFLIYTKNYRMTFFVKRMEYEKYGSSRINNMK